MMSKWGGLQGRGGLLLQRAREWVRRRHCLDGQSVEHPRLQPGVIRAGEHVPLGVVRLGEFRIRPVAIARTRGFDKA